MSCQLSNFFTDGNYSVVSTVFNKCGIQTTTTGTAVISSSYAVNQCNPLVQKNINASYTEGTTTVTTTNNFNINAMWIFTSNTNSALAGTYEICQKKNKVSIDFSGFTTTLGKNIEGRIFYKKTCAGYSEEVYKKCKNGDYVLYNTLVYTRLLV